MEVYYRLNSDKTGLAIKSDISYFLGQNDGPRYDDAGRLVIPSEAEYAGKTYPVVEIGDHAYEDWERLTSIVIPDSVTKIGRNAFGGCTGLTSIVVSEDNKIFDSRNNCNAIIETESNTLIVGCTSTVIPDSVTKIGEYAFYGCKGLISINIPNLVTEIGANAFCRCTGLTSIVIPESVRIVGDGAFDRCSNLNVVIAQRKEYLYIRKKEDAFEDLFSNSDSCASFDGCKSVKRQCRRSKIIDIRFLDVPVAFSAEWVFQALSIPFTIFFLPLVLLLWPFYSLVSVTFLLRGKLKDEEEEVTWREVIGLMLKMFIPLVILVNILIARFFEKIVIFMVKPFKKRKSEETQIE